MSLIIIAGIVRGGFVDVDLEGSGENVSVDCDIETISGIYFVPCKTILSCIEKDRVPCKQA